MHHFPGFGLHLKFLVVLLASALHFITLNRDLPGNMLEDVFHQHPRSYASAGGLPEQGVANRAVFRVVTVGAAMT